MTEGHFGIPCRNRCGVISSRAAGVAYARCLNVQERNGDVLDIATPADFFEKYSRLMKADNLIMQ